MKVNGGPVPGNQPVTPSTTPPAAAGKGPVTLPGGKESVPVDPALSARQQLVQLQLANRETALARVAEILQQKGGGHELLLELRGRTLTVNVGNRPPEFSAGDLIKVMRAGNELQLMGKLAASQESTMARALAQRLPWQQSLPTGLQQLVSSLNNGVRPMVQPGQPPSANPAQPLPAAARQALESVLASLPKSNELAPGVGRTESTASQVRQWLSESGLFAESRLLQSSPKASAPNDLKLALARIASALLASQGQTSAHFNRLTPSSSPELMQAPLQYPQTATAPPTPQASTAEPASTGQVLRLLAGMLNRITVNQLHSQTLTTRAGGEAGAPVNTLLVDLPWLTPQQEPRAAQLRMEQYESNEENSGARSGRTSVSEWRLSLSMDLDEAGPLHFEVGFRYPDVSARVWAEKQTTLRQVNEELPLLRKSLTDLGLEVTDLECRRGAPKQAQTRLEHRLVDTKA